MWRSMYFVGHIIMLSIVATGFILPAPKKRKGNSKASTTTGENGGENGESPNTVTIAASSSGQTKED